MDTISRENNTSIVPIAGLIAGVVAALLAVFALVRISTVKKDLAATDAKVTTAEESSRLATERADTAKSAADNATRALNSLATQTQGGFDKFRESVQTLADRVVKLETTPARTAAPAKGAAAAGANGAAAPAGGTQADGSYVVKPGDYPVKIAKALGITSEALMAANPGVNPKSLKVGQKLNVPKR